MMETVAITDARDMKKWMQLSMFSTSRSGT